VACVCLVLYATFLFVQTVRHKDYFLARDPAPIAAVEPTALSYVIWVAGGLLILSLSGVVLLAESLAPFIEGGIAWAGAPAKLAGVIVAAIVLLPETMAAFKAARRNRLQTSINLALGSAVSSIGLTVPTVAMIALWIGHPLALGTDAGSAVLLALSFVMAMLTYGQGRTNLLSGIVHLVLLACYVFLIFDP
jgi:Ca2+:H+ antiporter